MGIGFLFWPIRTGVTVMGDTAYFAASLLPWKESYLCAVDALTGLRKVGTFCQTDRGRHL